jgi:hypothetical protein
MGLTPLQQALLLCGLAGLVLGVLLTLAGLHELSHRIRMADSDHAEAADDDTAEFEVIGGAEATRPARRGRW